ncbi:MAG: hypothetical protein BWY85_02411 [Firmicutes bacterium ADurb.Bin506]|nr:MAG: hypothetical protein BWY85_02411 [Firmicutes bacterium ADurb.Bin506]
MKGTVMAPVVAPDASKAMARNSDEENTARIAIIAYAMNNNMFRRFTSTILSSPAVSITAIPTDTTTTRPALDITPAVTCSTSAARICRSGSAMDIMKPRARPAAITIHALLVLVTDAPIALPMGVTPMSTPNKNTDSPSITATDPTRNLSKR